MPLIFSVDSDNQIYQGQNGVVVSGTDFGSIAPDPLDPENFAALIASPSADINDVARLILTDINAWLDDQIIVTIPMGLPAAPSYWYVIRFDGLQSVDPVLVDVRSILLPAAQVWVLASDSLTWISRDLENPIPTLTTQAGESRLFTFDLSQRAELVAGSSLVGVPTVTVTSGSGVTVGAIAITSVSHVQVRLTPATQNRLVRCMCTVSTASGSLLVAEGYLEVMVPKVSTLRAFATEIRPMEFRFSARAEMVGGDTLTGTPLLSSDDASLIVMGSPIIDPTNTRVQFQVVSTAVEKLYQLSCGVTTAAGNFLKGSGDLYVS